MKSWELQQGLRTRLAGYSGLSSLVGTRVYDHVPQDAAFPFVVIGDDTMIPFDTHSTIGGEHTVQVHTWSRYRGNAETKQIQSQIYNALHRYALTVSGGTMVDCQCEYAETFLDADGLTMHGVTRFRVLVDG